MFITIEGPDKAGKTTQLEMLMNYSKSNSKDWVFTRNPGGTELGNKLRDIVLDDKETIPDEAELMLYLADRAHHVSEFLKPELAKGKTVICDRFMDSTVAYQGYGRGIDIALIKKMNSLVCSSLKPDLTILLMVSDKVAEERAAGSSKDRLEMQNKLFFERVRNGFRILAREDITRFKVIDTDQLSPEDIHKQVIKIIDEAMSKREELLA